jgi:hypothetical protein
LDPALADIAIKPSEKDQSSDYALDENKDKITESIELAEITSTKSSSNNDGNDSREEALHEPAVSQSDGSYYMNDSGYRSVGNFTRLKHDLSRYYGNWTDKESSNQYNFIKTGASTTSVDVYREGKLSRNYQLVETADGLSMMLYDNEANAGTAEYLLQASDDKVMQFFLPSDPTNFVRFELKKKSLIITEQSAASNIKTYKLKKME